MHAYGFIVEGRHDIEQCLIQNQMTLIVPPWQKSFSFSRVIYSIFKNKFLIVVTYTVAGWTFGRRICNQTEWLWWQHGMCTEVSLDLCNPGKMFLGTYTLVKHSLVKKAPELVEYHQLSVTYVHIWLSKLLWNHCYLRSTYFCGYAEPGS